MGSVDHSHETIARLARECGAGVVDLTRRGQRREAGKPDMIWGFAGVERLIEVKEEGGAPARERQRYSTRCGLCGKTYRKHAPGSHAFERQLVAAPARGGNVSRRQAKWHNAWPGHPVEVVRTADDVHRVLEEMARERSGEA